MDKQKKLEKIFDLVAQYKVSKYEIHKNTGISEAGVGKILNRAVKNPQDRTLDAILNYLLNKYQTEGVIKEMPPPEAVLIRENKAERETITNSHGDQFVKVGNKYKMTVKLVPVQAHATYVMECCDDVAFLDDLETIEFYVDHVAKGKYLAFEIKGDSMDNGGINDNPEGAHALARELGRHHWMDGFRESKYGWIIIHKDTLLCKDIVGFDRDKGTITCHSRNTSPEYPDFEISLNDVKTIFKIIKRSF